MKRKYSGVCCINQYPQTKPETCWLELQKDALSLRIRYTDETGTFSHKTSIHNHWTVSYHYKSSLRVCSIESMIVIRSFKMAHLRKNKSTSSHSLSHTEAHTLSFPLNHAFIQKWFSTLIWKVIKLCYNKLLNHNILNDFDCLLIWTCYKTLIS